jgi:FMN-dependent dehydrogenase
MAVAPKKSAVKKPVAKAAGKKSAARKPAAKSASVAKGSKKSSNPLGLEKKAPGQFDTLQEIALAAHRKLPAPVWDHLMGGADSEMTLRRNRAGLDALALRQRVLVDVRHIDLGTTLLGQDLAFPVSLARCIMKAVRQWHVPRHPAAPRPSSPPQPSPASRRRSKPFSGN